MKNIKILFAITCALALISIDTAQAQQVFIRKNKQAAPTEAIAPPPPVVIPSPVENSEPAPAVVETAPTASEETIEDFAKKYYKNCTKIEHPVLNGDQLKLLCECSAKKLTETMTVEEVQLMKADTPKGLTKRNYMAIHVYAPCMEYPVRAMLLDNCNQNKQVLAEHKNASDICTCMADDMARYTAQTAPSALAQKLIENPNDPDPLGGFMATPDFQARTQGFFMGCVQKHAPMMAP